MGNSKNQQKRARLGCRSPQFVTIIKSHVEVQRRGTMKNRDDVDKRPRIWSYLPKN